MIRLKHTLCFRDKNAGKQFWKSKSIKRSVHTAVLENSLRCIPCRLSCYQQSISLGMLKVQGFLLECEAM